MGTNSRSARSGQKSGIGKRPTRSSNIGSGPQVPHSSTVLLSPASTSSSRATSAPKRKNLTLAPSSRRSSANSRVSRRPARPSAPRPEHAEEIDEFIADIIVVNTDSPEHHDDMDDEVSESLIPGENLMRDPYDSHDHQQPSPEAHVAVESASESAETPSESATTGPPGANASKPVAAEEIAQQWTPAEESSEYTPAPDFMRTETTPLKSPLAGPDAVDIDHAGSRPTLEDKPLEALLVFPKTKYEDSINKNSLTNELFVPEAAGESVIDMANRETNPEEGGDAPTESDKPPLHPAEVKASAEIYSMVDRDNTGLDVNDLDNGVVDALVPAASPSSKRADHAPPLSAQTAGAAAKDPAETETALAEPTDKNTNDPSSIENNGSELVSHKEFLKVPGRSSNPAPPSSELSDLTDLDDISPSKASGTSEEVLSLGGITGQVDEASSELSDIVSADLVSPGAAHLDSTPAKSAISHLIGESRHSFASSASAPTEQSGLSSKPPSVSSKATTPFDTGSPREAASQPTALTPLSTPIARVQRRSRRVQFNVRPKVSIPTDLTPQEYAMECIEAAEHSRLNPYALHQDEYHILRYHLSHAQVTTYLNIRNGILRLWVRNPQIAVTREEAIGCARDTRWFDVANVCFDWLVRRGFINYGCVEIHQSRKIASAEDSQPRKRKTVVVIGAGFSGLGCARQLEGLFTQYSKRFRNMGEDPPRVVVLEGRNRVGGRVYSRAFHTLPDTAPGIFRGKRFTAEMGGMIITGFDRGNPLNILVRGQLSLPYHCLRSDMSLYDTNGTAVDPARDEMVEHLFNACLDRVSEYKFRSQQSKLIEGNHDLIDEGRDSTAEGHKTIAFEEEKAASQPHAPPVSQQNITPETHLVPVSTDRMTGKVHVEPGTPGSTRAAFKAKSLGWTLRPGVQETRDIDLDAAAIDRSATLGSVVDEALMQHKEILDLNAQDFRLLNWHIANLEYSNATNLNRLSLKGWDIDAGNEWEGKHTMVVGGYQSVARGLSMLPAPLNIRHKSAVKRIKYTTEVATGPARIDLEDGHAVEADYVVNTIPLGVLKQGGIEFQPPLPSWKTDAIERLGFGVLNKVILVYKDAFWDKDRDIFGTLQTPTNRLSLNQKDYVSRRGRFFQWFNVTNTTGMPCLLALMAGDAGYDTEMTPNDELIAEATEVLRMRYGARVPSQPLEAVVTRWESDRFARGSYSNAGVKMQAEDYQIMARPIGNLHFAGEHTIVTHPATVHGAYLSGLRAASDVLEEMLGPIEIPLPLVLPRETSASLKRKSEEENKDPMQARLEAYEMEIQEHIYSRLGLYPIKPSKVAGNPYLLFNKANYEEGRKRCEEGRRTGKGKPSPNEVRTMTSKMWKEATAEVRQPFEDAAEEQKRTYAQALKDWTAAAAKWDRDAVELRQVYVRAHPYVTGPDELDGEGAASACGVRRAKRVASYAEEDSDLDMD
ncbi:lysine-specific histone demethylase Aof2 [Diaporthe helianthi]|uniref:Lysine-specific histone demethylase Aof2 n=1 Tax=Diaporthe helianthi TaxID=158607 RepID=A0A2P5I422_DIAHE|nr:lysine-specific histone demethylase Aof2 [Diaporthe helianthi]